MKPQINDIGVPHAWLPRKTIALISKDPSLYTLNRLMNAWGFTRIKSKQQNYVPRGKCPFTKRDSTKERFKRFVAGNPQYSAVFCAHPANTVSQRKKIISLCQAKWRKTREQRKMQYSYVLTVSKGDLFQRVFSPVTWTSPGGIIMSQLYNGVSRQHNAESFKLSIFDLDKTIWDLRAEEFFEVYALTIDNVFWTNWKSEHGRDWRTSFVSTIFGPYSLRDIYMLFDDTWGANDTIFEFFKVYSAFSIGRQAFVTMLGKYENNEDLLMFLRLEIVRRECDRFGGTELMPISTELSCSPRTSCAMFLKHFLWFFSLVDFEFWCSGSDFNQESFNKRVCRISRTIPQRCCNSSGLASIPFHFFTSDIREFDSWTEESQRFFLVLSYYHLPNQVDELQDQCWKIQIQKVFTSFTSSWNNEDYFNIQELVTLSASFLDGDCKSSITRADIHHKTLSYLRKMRFPTFTEEDSPVTKTDVPDELEIEDIESSDNDCACVTIGPIHSTVNRKRERSPTMCSPTMRNTRPRLHEEAEITSGAKLYKTHSKTLIAPLPNA